MTNKAAAGKIIADAVERSSWDPAFFLRFFLPHWFRTLLPPFHLGVIALVTKKVEFLNEYPDAHEFLLNEFKYAADPDDAESVELPVFRLDDEGNFVMVCGDHNNLVLPRGFSKTTLLNGLNLYEVATDGTIFCVYISKSADHAEMQLQNIKIELESNVLLRQAYGNVVPDRSDAEKWQADNIQLLNGAILVARGRGGQVRGLNYRARRPNRILLDDVEDDGSVESPTLRKSTEKWFYSAVEKAGQLMDGAVGEEWAQQPLQITNLGTLLGIESLIMTLRRDPKFNTVKFGANLRPEQPDNPIMLWPFKMSSETYLKDRARHRRIGKLAEFTREIDSAIRVSDDSIFPSVFIYQPTALTDLVARAQFLDPAISEADKADSSALVVAGRRATDGALWFLDEWGDKGKTPREQIDAFFEYHAKWRTTHNGIEGQAFQKALQFLMREEMARKKYFFHITTVVRGSDEVKEKRITGVLSPRYANGYIRHLRPLPKLEANIIEWPNGKKDFADAAASALTLLGESAMLVADAATLDEPEHEPLPQVLPPAYNSVSGYIMNGARAIDPRVRYPVGGR